MSSRRSDARPTLIPALRYAWPTPPWLSLLTQSGLEPVFRIGIDSGDALGCALGQEPRLFNLWGDVIRTAELMAQSATDTGSIQVSERAYERLRQEFLFRARGVFYVPRIGVARVFILAGRR